MKHWHPSVESYVALLLVCVGVVPAFLHGGLMEQMSPAWCFAWLFAISGVRRSEGVARLAAIASLTVLIFHAIVLGVAGYMGAWK